MPIGMFRDLFVCRYRTSYVSRSFLQSFCIEENYEYPGGNKSVEKKIRIIDCEEGRTPCLYWRSKICGWKTMPVTHPHHGAEDWQEAWTVSYLSS